MRCEKNDEPCDIHNLPSHRHRCRFPKLSRSLWDIRDSHRKQCLETPFSNNASNVNPLIRVCPTNSYLITGDRRASLWERRRLVGLWMRFVSYIRRIVGSLGTGTNTIPRPVWLLISAAASLPDNGGLQGKKWQQRIDFGRVCKPSYVSRPETASDLSTAYDMSPMTANVCKKERKEATPDLRQCPRSPFGDVITIVELSYVTPAPGFSNYCTKCLVTTITLTIRQRGGKSKNLGNFCRT